jgi:ABC-type Fe3+ transport system permease subunit
MKTENRIALDCAMLLVLLMLMVKLMTGVIVHEALGVGFVLLAAVHLWRQRGQLRNIGRKKVRLAINFLLLCSLIGTAVSGILLSVSIFSFLNIPYHDVFYTVHALSAYALLILAITHLALHMKMIRAFFHKKQEGTR